TLPHRSTPLPYPTLFRSKSSRPAPSAPAVRFSVIGLNHGHIYGQTQALLRNGAQVVSFYAKEADLAERFSKRFPDAKLARSEQRSEEHTSELQSRENLVC